VFNFQFLAVDLFDFRFFLWGGLGPGFRVRGFAAVKREMDWMRFGHEFFWMARNGVGTFVEASGLRVGGFKCRI
jgi:hypothetical protein